jgi:hypothetical protein
MNRAFAIACSHYAASINLEVMSQGYAPGYEDNDLEKMEDDVAHLPKREGQNYHHGV